MNFFQVWADDFFACRLVPKTLKCARQTPRDAASRTWDHLDPMPGTNIFDLADLAGASAKPLANLRASALNGKFSRALLLDQPAPNRADPQ
jgi:hypothetical protein